MFCSFVTDNKSHEKPKTNSLSPCLNTLWLSCLSVALSHKPTDSCWRHKSLKMGLKYSFIFKKESTATLAALWGCRDSGAFI